MLSQNKNISKQTAHKQHSGVEISRLINSIYYFIEFVFILKKDNQYRLIALDNRGVLNDRSYKTDIGAKVAFTQLYKNNAWKEGIKAEWSVYFSPDQKWLSNKLQIVDKLN